MERINTLVEDIERLGIGGLAVGGVDGLADIPYIAGLGAAHVWEFARFGVGIQPAEVFFAIERLNFETFVCLPNEFFLKIGAFQIDRDGLQPFFG